MCAMLYNSDRLMNNSEIEQFCAWMTISKLEQLYVSEKLLRW